MNISSYKTCFYINFFSAVTLFHLFESTMVPSGLSIRASAWWCRDRKMSPRCVIQVWDLTSSVERTVNEMIFMESEPVLQKRTFFTPTTTGLTLTPGHRRATPETAWLHTQQSASWTNITWIQFSCNHFPFGVHCAQLALRRFAPSKNWDFPPCIFLNPHPSKKQSNYKEQFIKLKILERLQKHTEKMWFEQ